MVSGFHGFRLEYFDAVAKSGGDWALLPVWVERLLEGGLVVVEGLKLVHLAIRNCPLVLVALESAVTECSACQKDAAKNHCCKEAENQDFHQRYDKYGSKEQ